MVELVKLFEPIDVGTMRLSNRIVFPAVGTRFVSVTGEATQRDVDHFRVRAQGGAGLLIVPWVLVDTKLGKKTGRFRLDTDEYARGLHEIVDAVHLKAAKIAIQLAHPGRAMTPEETADRIAVAPSESYVEVFGTKARALRTQEIEYLVECFASAACRAKKVGFDAVEFHGANGWLISQFLSPYVNKRRDRYGGDVSRRMTFLLEILQRTKQKAGSDYPILVRISGDEFVDGGLTLEDSKFIAKNLVDAGVDCIDVTMGIVGASYHKSMPPMAVPRGAYIHLAAGIKEAVHVPVIGVGRINDPVLAEKILEEGRADLVAMGRALLADPELPRKARKGALEDIVPCIACNRCEMATSENLPITCTVNPRLGRERCYELRPAEKPKHILVVGGGPAGMISATIAAFRGHDVKLYEKLAYLGGQLFLAGIPPHKEEMNALLEYLTVQLKKSGAKVVLGIDVTADFVMRLGPDAVILATGATPIVPKIPGIERPTVVQAWDILKGQCDAKGSVVVVGAGCQGCETAEFLAAKGKEVTIIEMLPELAWDMEPFTRIFLLERFKKYGVKVHTSTTVDEIGENVIRAKDKNRQRLTIPADTVVMCVGQMASNSLFNDLQGMVSELHCVGDSNEPARLLEAVHAATHVGCQI